MPSVNCCIEGCGNNAFKAKQQGVVLHFHRFPKDPYIRDQWMLRCVKDDTDNIDGARVCSDHFSIDDYDDIIKAKLNNTHPKVLKSTGIIVPVCFHIWYNKFIFQQYLYVIYLQFHQKKLTLHLQKLLDQVLFHGKKDTISF